MSEMEKIKLVIWDLDETFWKGTLSEEGITSIPDHIEVMKKLVDRGIMNAVVSKNDFEPAQAELEKLGVWQYIIFPHIDWVPKGSLVTSIITKAQLRAPNILFLDDNHINRKEVEFYNSGIHVRGPEFIPKLLNHPALKGKEDSDHTRLTQYRILEAKESDRKVFSDNTAFLRSSNIKIEFVHDLKKNITRIAELVERTNQLNFTKKRDSQDQLQKIVESDAYSCGAIKVFDKYGDYGIVGFYAIRKSDNTLEHFVFSCRTINLGIEQFMLDYLEYPTLKIIGDVSSELEKNSRPEWITISMGDERRAEKQEAAQTLIFLKGGCDLDQMVHYLTYKNVSVSSEFNHVDMCNHQVHREHTAYVLQSIQLSQDAKRTVVSELPFIDEMVFTTDIFKTSYDVLVYSVLMDYTQVLYRHNDTGVLIAFGGYDDLTSEDEHIFAERFRKRGVDDMDESFLRTFKSHYTYVGQITPEDFKKNISIIAERIAQPILFINGAEVDTPFENTAEQAARHRHEVMNAALDDVVARYDHCHVLDVRSIVSQEDITNNIRHYRRDVYVRLADLVAKRVAEAQGITLTRSHPAVMNRIKVVLRGLYGKSKGVINTLLDRK